MRSPRYVCIHGHFYQPPRENPWLDVVEVQDSAAPDHDWNVRITRECYAPNTRARLLDDRGKIVNLLNNYAWMSFNFGPTLLHWMQGPNPEVVQRIVEADQISSARRGGHGNAVAQVYNHMILPLASPRDQRTQVAWGLADFRQRFGRKPEGMWLAETAVDIASLEVLAEAGITFTILAPNQARRWRPIGQKEWVEIGGGVDPSRAYRCKLPSGRTIALFFYDGIIAREVAFERLLDDGERFLHRLLEGFDDRRTHAQLMHIATDGESYGHHHPHGDMAMAYVLDRLANHPEVRLTNYGEYLELNPPEWEVEIHENSSWSCAHGVERWRSDCGCKFRGDWHQKWRAPLRRALDGLKEGLDHLFATRGRECFPDPWAARDGYIDVVLAGHDPEAVQDFLGRHGHPDLDAIQTQDALRLLEMQRDAMLMYTSCGWFFDEISGLETTQCLKYAARAVQLARHFHRDLEPELLAALEEAPSNLPEFGNGRRVWEKAVEPTRVDLERVLAHHAISSVYRVHAPRTRVYSYDLETNDLEVRHRGPSRLAVGRLRVRSCQIGNEAQTTFVVIHYGGLDFHAVLRESQPDEVYEGFKARLLETYRTGSLADVTTLVASEFPGKAHRLDDLFREEQRRVVGIVLQERLELYHRAFAGLADQDEDLLNRLAQLSYPIPKPLAVAAAIHLDEQLRREVERVGAGGGIETIRMLAERGRTAGYTPERALLGKALSDELCRTLGGIDPESDASQVTSRATNLVEAATLLGAPLDVWQAQNRLLDAYLRIQEGDAVAPSLLEAFCTLAAKLQISQGILGWRP